LATHHGKSQKEASPKDEQAQAPEALEVESPQEAYVAEIGRRGPRLSPHPNPPVSGGFFCRRFLHFLNGKE
jgi:hypothetical protein